MKTNKNNLTLFFLGTLFNSIVFFSFGPIFVSLFFYLFGKTIIKIFYLNDQFQKQMFNRVFSISWFVSSILFLISLHISFENYIVSDAFEFYELAISGDFFSNTDSLILIDGELLMLARLTNGWGIGVIWAYLYYLFELIGIENNEYIGVLLNITVISITGCIVVDIFKKSFSSKAIDLEKLINFFSLSSLLWLLSALHLRDVYSLFLIVLNTLFWINFFTKKTLKNIIFLIIVSLINIILFPFVRIEFIFIPLLMFVIGICIYGLNFKRFFNKFIFFLFGISLVVALLSINYSTLIDIYSSSFEGYEELSKTESVSNSLGLVVVSLPFPFNVLSKLVITVIAPIPFWAGFNLEGSYQLLKSLNTLYMYFTLPLFYIFLKNFFSTKSLRNSKSYFLLLLLIAFTFIISQTSKDSRHLGNIIFIYIMFISTLDFNDIKIWVSYKNNLIYVWSFVFLVHIFWILIKAV